LKASDLFVRCLEAEGVEKIFGVPGEENADFMISLIDSPIEFVLCRHEQAAAFMADGYGRLTGKAGVCLSTLGPGVTNLVTGLADANMDRAPTVAIIGQASTSRLHKESHQNMDSIRMLRPISKWAHSIYKPDTIPEMVRKAFKIAEQEKPGVTVLELPEDIAKKEAESPTLIEPRKTRRAAADHKAVKAAVDAIMNAKNPIILSGNGAIRKRASNQLRRMAEKTGIRVVNTFMGKGAVSRSDPHCLYTIGLQGQDHVNAALYEADVVVAIGYDLVEYAPKLWNKQTKKTIVHIDFWAAEIDEDYIVDVEVVSDVADALWQINELLDAEYKDKLPLSKIEDHQTLRKTITDDFEMEKDDKTFPMKPQKVLWDIREILEPSDILLSDVGAHKMWIARYYQCDEPNTCLISNGFCTMGFAFPAGMGAKFAFPDTRVVAVCGDAGFLMNVQDIETAVRHKLNIVTVILMDGEYGLIKWKQQNQFEGKHSELKFDNPDFAMLAQSFGAWGKVISSADEFKPALEEAFKQNGPALIGVPIDYSENMKLTKRLGELQFTI
jgi:acetolactate synthase-1/2/3 large subunit|tara:strand:+ start:221 stop:1882 length:1662 start_codon:yes stop_codon:yes gene_type:complete